MNSQSSDNYLSFAWLSVILNCVLEFVGALMKILHWPGANVTITAGILFLLLVWGLVINDILRVKISNKPLWMIAVFIFGSLAALVYLVQRDSLLANNPN